jgi:transcriptional regulator with XRE-family HTH domain
MKPETNTTTPPTPTDEVRAQWLPAMRRARKELGMTQAQFATAIGMSKDAVTSWECGRNRICITSALRMSARLQRNIIGGNTDPISSEELIHARLREYERRLRLRLGL